MKKILFSVLLLTGCFCFAQEAQIPQVATDANYETIYIDAYRGTRLMYGRAAQTSPKGHLDINLEFRFASVDRGFYEWFGLDSAYARIGVDYAITDRFMVGFGRTKLNKEFDLNLSYKIMRQSKGAKNMPLTISLYGAGMVSSTKAPQGTDIAFGDRLSSVLQLLVARNFMDRFSLQVAPIWVYNAVTPLSDDPHHIFSVGLGGQVKITKGFKINVEYYPLFDGVKFEGTNSPLSVGVNLETRGHIFQIFLGNSMGTNEHLMLTTTHDKWTKGKIHIGFNLVRTFRLID